MKKLSLALLLLPNLVFADNIDLFLGTGIYHHTDGPAYGLSVALPKYRGVYVSYDKWEDNYAWAASYKFQWKHLSIPLGLGLAGHRTDGIYDTVIFRVGIFTPIYGPLSIGVLHWSSPGDDSGENAAGVSFNWGQK